MVDSTHVHTEGRSRQGTDEVGIVTHRKAMRRTVATCKKPQTRSTSKKTTASPSCPVSLQSIPRVPWKTDKVIILDLDHTMLDSTGHKNAHPERLYVLKFGNETLKGSLRPYAREFVRFLQEYGKVIIWTAATQEYADQVVDILFDEGERPLAVWGRDYCRVVPDGTGKGYYVKPTHNAVASLGLDPESALIIDDNSYTFEKTNRDNGLLIDGYYGDNEDRALLDVMNWFVTPQVMNSYSMTQLPKSGIFTSVA